MIYDIDIDISIGYSLYIQLKETVRKGRIFWGWQVSYKWGLMLMNRLGYFETLRSIKKIEKLRLLVQVQWMRDAWIEGSDWRTTSILHFAPCHAYSRPPYIYNLTFAFVSQWCYGH